MKLLPKHTTLRIFAYVLILIGFFLVMTFPYAITDSFIAHSILLLMAILLIFTPWGNRRPPAANFTPKPLPLLKVISLTLVSQVAVVAAFYSICHLIAVSMPNLTPVVKPPLPMFMFSFKVLLWQWGLFPWGMFTLLAAALTYNSYIKQRAGDMSTLIRPLFRNRVGDMVSIAADVAIKIAIALTLVSSLALISMECLALIAHQLHLPLASGMRLDVLIVTVIILILNKGRYWQQLLTKLLQRQYSPPLVISLLLVTMILALLILGAILHWGTPLYLDRIAQPLNFVPIGWVSLWGVFVGVWWLCWAPLMGGLYAYIWRGYRIRTMVLGTLLPPILVAIIWAVYPHWQLTISNNTSWLNFIPAVFAAVVIISLFLRTPYIPYAWKATLPTGQRLYKRSPVDYLYRLIQGIVLVMGVYWTSGIYLMSISYFIVTYVAAITIVVSGIAFYKTLFTRE